MHDIFRLCIGLILFSPLTLNAATLFAIVSDRGIGQSGAGYEPVGQVYRDSKTGKLILIGEPHDNK